MSQGLLITTDVHGCWLTLQALLAKHPDRRVILLGDLIDRGPRSKEVVEWAINNRIPCVLGNHEHLAIDYCVNQMNNEPSNYMDGLWLMNGGLDCLRSFCGEFTDKARLPNVILGWMQQLPLHLILEEYPNLLLSHTGHGLITKDSQHTPFDAIWDRSYSFPDDGYYRVLGHNKEREPVVNDKFAMIDTGAAYRGYHKLTGMLWPEREIVQQEYID